MQQAGPQSRSPYRQDENAANAIVSYYKKGSLVALALDLHLRAKSGGTKSRDEVLRFLWQRYGAGVTLRDSTPAVRGARATKARHAWLGMPSRQVLSRGASGAGSAGTSPSIA